MISAALFDATIGTETGKKLKNQIFLIHGRGDSKQKQIAILMKVGKEKRLAQSREVKVEN